MKPHQAWSVSRLAGSVPQDWSVSCMATTRHIIGHILVSGSDDPVATIAQGHMSEFNRL